MSGSHMLFVVDGQLHRRNAICRLLAEHQVYAEPFESPAELRSFRPGEGAVLVADEGDEVATLIADMAASSRWLPVIAFSEAPSPQGIARAIREGATSYAVWPCAPGELIAAIDEARRNSEIMASLHMRTIRARSRLERLTKRERQVLEAITDGLSNREIGVRLSISPRTVEIHRSNMLSKVGADHTSAAIRIAVEASLADNLAASPPARRDASKMDKS